MNYLDIAEQVIREINESKQDQVITEDNLINVPPLSSPVALTVEEWEVLDFLLAWNAEVDARARLGNQGRTDFS